MEKIIDWFNSVIFGQSSTWARLTTQKVFGHYLLKTLNREEEKMTLFTDT